MEASLFTFTDAQLLSLGVISSTPGQVNPISVSANTYTDGKSMALNVGYLGFLTTLPVAQPSVTYGLTNVDLSAFDTYGLRFFNDNDDRWGIQLYVNGQSLPVTPVGLNGTDNPPPQGTSLYMDLTGMAGLSNASIGFTITYLDNGGADAYHMSVAQVPEPSALLLLGFGLASTGLFLRKGRQR